MTKRVEIIVGKDGSVRAEAFDFKGASCEQATDFLDKLFGNVKKNFKPSYYEEEEVKDNLVDGLPTGDYCG